MLSRKEMIESLQMSFGEMLNELNDTELRNEYDRWFDEGEFSDLTEKEDPFGEE